MQGTIFRTGRTGYSNPLYQVALKPQQTGDEDPPEAEATTAKELIGWIGQEHYDDQCLPEENIVNAIDNKLFPGSKVIPLRGLSFSMEHILKMPDNVMLENCRVRWPNEAQDEFQTISYAKQIYKCAVKCGDKETEDEAVRLLAVFFKKAIDKLGKIEPGDKEPKKYFSSAEIDVILDLRKAAAHGNKEASCQLGKILYQLGLMYSKGHHFDTDDESAVNFLMEAYHYGNNDAMFQLGKFNMERSYRTCFMRRNPEKAIECYELAAQNGHQEARKWVSDYNKPFSLGISFREPEPAMAKQEYENL